MSRFRQISRPILTSIRQEIPNRTPKLLLTVFGDTIQPHGGEIWLGSLIRLLKPLGINERLVRTSVFRLARDGWLESTREGRRSFYRLTPTALPSVESAERRIYHAPQRHWNGRWNLVFTGTAGITSEQRAELRKRLSWLGFGTIAPNVFGHPCAPMEPVWELFEALDVSGQAAVMRAQRIDSDQGLSTAEMVSQCFDLRQLEHSYRKFIRRYSKLGEALAAGAGPSGEEPVHCFILKTMLVHHYRRLLLRDPQLPAPLLPRDWAGSDARRLCATLYRALAPQAARFVTATCENRDGPYRAIGQKYRRRFGK